MRETILRDNYQIVFALSFLLPHEISEIIMMSMSQKYSAIIRNVSHWNNKSKLV